MRLFVGNLKRQVTELELTGLFSKYGTVLSARLSGSKFSSSPNINAFVEMQDKTGAEAAITALNNSVYLDQVIAVAEAKSNNKGKWRYAGS